MENYCVECGGILPPGDESNLCQDCFDQEQAEDYTCGLTTDDYYPEGEPEDSLEDFFNDED